ncbi:hypothetical protein RBG61_04065 [Paludicola sp. MB14-C6]|uniref:hypothetical protein n=1 Tax=Paludihabitans sp. MB14-C6 TaxID=3070656 RepID=UPI0027DE82B3|nr:hypothetical protein [Paludicola sp. MB14-C6]WMJ23850.1 hypothetical protein RBG61_04065 [Paludicola sp. MB14-C6]
MKTTNELLLNWTIEKIKKEYNNDVALLIGNTSLKMEQDKEGSYFDYFVPINEKGNNLAETFIINGIGYDLYPRSWKRLEDMANLLDDNNLHCLADGEILYYKNEEVKNKFISLQDKLKKNLQDKELMSKKSLEKLAIAMELYQTMMFEESIGNVRMAAGFIADFLSLAVAYSNHTYFKYNQVEQIKELFVMKTIPDNFIEYYKAIINADSINELKNLCHLIILTTRKYIKMKKAPIQPSHCEINYTDLSFWYQELCYTWRRIYFYCDNKDVEKVFIWSCYLQQELNTIKEEFKLQDMDLLGHYHSNNLSDIRNQANVLEKYIVSEITTHGVQLNAFESIDEFLSRKS